MNQEHKDILRTNRTKLVEGIGDIKKVVNRLYEKKVITGDMMELILESNHTTSDKKRELLDMIPRRGPNAFNDFIQALKDCEEWDAVECLKPGLGRAAEQAHKSSSHSQPEESRVPVVTTPVEDDLPKVWPDASYDPMSVKVKQVREDDHYMRNKFTKCGMTDSEFYCLQQGLRGLVLIINNEDFKVARETKGMSLDDREGTNMDATSLDDLFKALHFRVETTSNLTAQKITDVMTRYSKQNHSDEECFVCCILSHGTGGGVYGVDGEVAKIQDLTDLFNSSNCVSLAGKPKLFFIQACQGNKVDCGSVGATSVHIPQQSVPEDDISLKKVKKEQDDVLKKFENLNIDTKSDADTEENVPSRADTFVAFATTPDYLSYRNTRKGTWFIQAVTYIFQNYAHAEHLLDMMTKVNQLVSRGEIQSKGHKQVSNFSSSFRKKLYFFPGLFTSQSDQPTLFNQIQPSS